jgi:hypothetical protein
LKPEKLKPSWFRPVCDQVLIKVAWWRENYTRGEVYSTCPFHDPNLGVIDKPTGYAHRMAWTKAEFDHLVRIMAGWCKDAPLIEELRIIRDKVLPNGRLIPGNKRVITLAFYFQHVDLIYQTLLEAKNGKSSSIEEFREEGKGIFE